MAVPAPPSQPAPMLASRYSSATLGGYLLREAIRLRHLRQVVLRNIQGEGIDKPVDCRYIIAYPGEDGKVLYRSSVAMRTLNPDWSKLEDLPKCVSEIKLLVQIRRPGETEWEKLIEKTFKFSHLEFSQVLMRNEGLSVLGYCPPNTLVFILDDGIYGFQGQLQPSRYRVARPARELKITNSALLQFHARLLKSVTKFKSLLSEREKLAKTLGNILKEADDRISKSRRTRASLAMLTEMHTESSAKLKSLKEKMKIATQCRSELKTRAEMTLNLWKVLKKKKEELAKVRHMKSSRNREKMLSHMCVHLRQLRMLYILYEIYPVHRSIDQKKREVYTIRGMTIADTVTAGVAREMCVALGYCGHLILLIAKYTNTSLRFRIIHRGSKSWVEDNVVDPSRRLPLFFNKDSGGKVVVEGIRMLITNASQILERSAPLASASHQKRFKLDIHSEPAGPTLLQLLWRLQQQINPSEMKQ